uniref:Uncharacterized protein n=1 Tax=Mola mola TaxID=94237 RepID=A0A3Q3X2W3_MOLML
VNVLRSFPPLVKKKHLVLLKCYLRFSYHLYHSWCPNRAALRSCSLKLGFTEDAQSLFNKATEAFCRTRAADSDEGPWLVVNCGNQVWLHHPLGEQTESQAYLSKVDALVYKYPSVTPDDLHPEIYAEKAWTPMKFGPDKPLLTAVCFEKAIRMQLDMVEWHTSYVLGLVGAQKHSNTVLEDELLEKIRIAREQGPENLYLAVHYLDQRAKKGEKELRMKLETDDLQRLCKIFKHARHGSLQYQMKAAKIPRQSFFCENSIRALEKIRDRSRNRMCRETEKFLEKLQES